MQEFLNMGGYGAYVWSAFGLTLAVLGFNVLAARKHLTQAKLQAKRRLQTGHGERQ